MALPSDNSVNAHTNASSLWRLARREQKAMAISEGICGAAEQFKVRCQAATT